MNRKIIKPTPFGSVGIMWTVLNDNPRIVRVLLSKPALPAEHQMIQAYPDSQVSSCKEIDGVVEAIIGILEGEDIAIPLNIADLDLCSAFQQSVLRAEHRIPRGSVSTYRLIAVHLGRQSTKETGSKLHDSHKKKIFGGIIGTSIPPLGGCRII